MNRLLDEGHLLGAHSWAHAKTDTFANDLQFERDIEEFERAFFELTGDRPWFYRAPHGIMNAYMLHYL